MITELRYNPLPTARLVHASQAELIAIVGPWGSGKSTIADIDLYQYCLRWSCDALVIRDSYPSLKDSCLKKFMETFKSAGELNMGPPPTFHWKGPLRGRTVMFRSAEVPGDIQKFGSVEVGYAWLEEVCPGLQPGGVINSGISAEVLSGVIGRVRKWGTDNRRRRILVTSLPPPTTRHWFHKLFYDKRPLMNGLDDAAMKTLMNAIELYRINADENKANLPPNYYELQTAFLTSQDQIDRFIKGEVGSGYGVAGVYSRQWNDSLHIARVEPVTGPLLVGIDGGLDASAIILQPQPDGRMFVLSELVTSGLGLEDFGYAVSEHIARLYGAREIDAWADPAIFARSQSDGQDAALWLRRGGITAKPAPQDPDIRISAVRTWLSRMTNRGAMIQVHPHCEMLIEGMRGAYRFKIAGGEVLVGRVEKNEFSHVQDALQYPLAALITRPKSQSTQKALTQEQLNPLGRFLPPRRGLGRGVEQRRMPVNSHSRRWRLGE